MKSCSAVANIIALNQTSLLQRKYSIIDKNNLKSKSVSRLLLHGLKCSLHKGHEHHKALECLSVMNLRASLAFTNDTIKCVPTKIKVSSAAV